jgi:hypothetical protein
VSNSFGQEPGTKNLENRPITFVQKKKPADQPWVVLSNLTFKREGIAGVFEVDYKLVEGAPEEGAEYVWVVQVGVGTRLQKYAEFPITLKPEGDHLKNGARGLGSVADNAETYFAKRTEPLEGSSLRRPANEKISGVLKQGEEESAAKRPLTIAELAGSDAVGKLFAIAKPRIGDGRGGRKSFSVDFQLQGESGSNARYFWIIKPATGTPLQFDVTLTVRRNKSGTGTLNATPLGIKVEELQGPFEMSLETPKNGGSIRGPRETISNTISLE